MYVQEEEARENTRTNKKVKDERQGKSENTKYEKHYMENVSSFCLSKDTSRAVYRLIL